MALMGRPVVVLMHQDSPAGARSAPAHGSGSWHTPMPRSTYATDGLKASRKAARAASLPALAHASIPTVPV